MARINIDDNLFTKPQFIKLTKLSSYNDAIALYVQLTLLAQKFISEGRLIPLDEIELVDDYELLIKCKMLIPSGDMFDYFDNSQFDWLISRRANGKKGH